MDVPDVPAALPRLAPFVLERERLLSRCAPSHASFTVVLAAAGSGKSVLAAQIAARAPKQFAYVQVRIGEDRASLVKRLRLACAGGRTAIVDDAHLADSSGREAIREYLNALERSEHAIVCARTAEGLVDPRALFDGSANVVDYADLAFTAAEIRELCRRFKVAFQEHSLAEFMTRTACWPMAVCGALRAAGERALAIGEAMDEWYRIHSRAVARFITDECARLPEGSAFLAHLQHPGPLKPEELAAWHACGLFVVQIGKEHRVIPAAYGVFGNEPRSAPSTPPRLRVSLLRHDVPTTIGDVRVRWVRHKDAQLFKYLVMKNGEPATRAELMAIFWPGRDKHIAAQNLRTTCSNIRRAIRAIVGADAVDDYFQSAGAVRVSAGALTDIDVFRKEVQYARLVLTGGDAASARAHFKAARDLYRADLLTGMPACGFEDLAASLRNDFGEAVHRLRTLPDFTESRATAS